MLSTRRGLHQGPSLGTLKLREGSLTPLITTVSLWLLALSRVPVTRRSVGVTLSAMKSNQWWHSITPHSAVATSARLRARVVQSCHQDIRTRRSLITSLHYTLLAFTFLLLISSMPPEFYRKPISSPPGQLDRVSLPRPQPLKVEHSGIITFIASCHARCSAHKRLCRQNKLPPIAWWVASCISGGPQIKCEKANFCPKFNNQSMGLWARNKYNSQKSLLHELQRKKRQGRKCLCCCLRCSPNFTFFTFYILSHLFRAPRPRLTPRTWPPAQIFLLSIKHFWVKR